MNHMNHSKVYFLINLSVSVQMSLKIIMSEYLMHFLDDAVVKKTNVARLKDCCMRSCDVDWFVAPVARKKTLLI